MVGTVQEASDLFVQEARAVRAIQPQEGSDVHPERNDNFMLVRYMPSGKFLLTLSQDRGDVKLWDVPCLYLICDLKEPGLCSISSEARSLELHCSLRPGECSVDCAFWEPRWAAKQARRCSMFVLRKGWMPLAIFRLESFSFRSLLCLDLRSCTHTSCLTCSLIPAALPQAVGAVGPLSLSSSSQHVPT